MNRFSSFSSHRSIRVSENRMLKMKSGPQSSTGLSELTSNWIRLFHEYGSFGQGDKRQKMKLFSHFLGKWNVGKFLCTSKVHGHIYLWTTWKMVEFKFTSREVVFLMKIAVGSKCIKIFFFQIQIIWFLGKRPHSKFSSCFLYFRLSKDRYPFNQMKLEL